MGIWQSIRVRLFGVKDPEGDIPIVRLHRTDSSGAIADNSNAPAEAETAENVETQPLSDAINANINTNEHNSSTKDIHRILFICSGNICRSPYGEVRLRQLSQRRQLDWQIASCGTLKLIGRSAAPLMIEAAQAHGLDLHSHRSSAISSALLEAADVIFAMAPEHSREIVRICPNAAPRTVMLGTWLATPKHQIDDPMGKPYDAYERAASEIDEALERWFAQF